MCMTLALAVRCTQVAVVHACSVSHCCAVVYRCMASYNYMSTVHGDVRVLCRKRKRKRGANTESSNRPVSYDITVCSERFLALPRTPDCTHPVLGRSADQGFCVNCPVIGPTSWGGRADSFTHTNVNVSAK